MPDRDEVIKAIEACMDQYHPAYCHECYLDGRGHRMTCREKLMRDALTLLKEQDKIEEQLIEAFNTIRNAYNIPANREKILLNYLLKIERTVKRDG